MSLNSKLMDVSQGERNLMMLNINLYFNTAEYIFPLS